MEKELIDQKQLVVEEDEIDLIDLLKTIYKNRKLIIGIATLVTILGIAFAMLQKKTYTSEITFVEQKSSSSSSMLSSLAFSIPFGLGSTLGSGEGSSLLTILDNRAFRIKISEKLKLRDYIIEVSKMKSEAQENFDIINVSEWLKKSCSCNSGYENRSV